MDRTHYQWTDLIAYLAVRPEQWTLMFPNRPVRLAKRIRLKQHPALRRDDGVLEERVLHEHDVDGVRRGDIWVRWVPSTNSTNEQETP
ncbi:MAG: hypothetical protein ABWY36_05385 [Leifsonia sp.]